MSRPSDSHSVRALRRRADSRPSTTGTDLEKLPHSPDTTSETAGGGPFFGSIGVVVDGPAAALATVRAQREKRRADEQARRDAMATADAIYRARVLAPRPAAAPSPLESCEAKPLAPPRSTGIPARVLGSVRSGSRSSHAAGLAHLGAIADLNWQQLAAELRARALAEVEPSTTAAERAAKAAKDAAADERYRRRYEDDCHARGWAADEEKPRALARDVWLMSWQVVGDHTGHVGRSYWRRAREVFGPWVLGAVWDAAFVPIGDTGLCRYDWADDRARRIVAVALVLLFSAEPMTRRKAFGGRSEKRGLCVRGVPIGALQSALAFPWSRDRCPSRTAVSGSAGDYEGYITALESAGFVQRGRPPADVAESWEIGRVSGHVFNRYWIAQQFASANPSRAERKAGQPREMLLGVPKVDDEFLARNGRGWDACWLEIERMPRGRALRELDAAIKCALTAPSPAPS